MTCCCTSPAITSSTASQWAHSYMPSRSRTRIGRANADLKAGQWQPRRAAAGMLRRAETTTFGRGPCRRKRQPLYSGARCVRGHIAPTRTFRAACSLAKCPRCRTALRNFALRLSIALVVYTILRSSIGNSRNGTNSAQLSPTNWSSPDRSPARSRRTRRSGLPPRRR